MRCVIAPALALPGFREPHRACRPSLFCPRDLAPVCARGSSPAGSSFRVFCLIFSGFPLDKPCVCADNTEVTREVLFAISSRPPPVLFLGGVRHVRLAGSLLLPHACSVFRPVVLALCFAGLVVALFPPSPVLLPLRLRPLVPVCRPRLLVFVPRSWVPPPLACAPASCCVRRSSPSLRRVFFLRGLRGFSRVCASLLPAVLSPPAARVSVLRVLPARARARRDNAKRAAIDPYQRRRTTRTAAPPRSVLNLRSQNFSS